MAVGSLNDGTKGQGRALAFRSCRYGDGRPGTTRTLKLAVMAALRPHGTNSGDKTAQSRRWASCG